MRAPLGSLACGLALLVAACRPTPAFDPAFLVLDVPSSPVDLDPRVGTDEVSQRAHQLLFDTLLALDEHLRPGPGLATHWETPNPTTYVVHLRRGVRFHDGHELAAADVVATFEAFLEPDFVSPRKGAYTLLESVSVRDRYTVEFHLSEPSGSFPINLVMAVVPADAAGDFGAHPVGTGPYQLAQIVPDERLVLQAFPDYFDGPPANPGIVLNVVPDAVMRSLELRRGTADLVVNTLQADVVHQFQQDPDLQVVTAPGTEYTYIGLNLSDSTLQDARVRQAMAYAVDRESIVRYLHRGMAQPAVGILSPSVWAFEPDVPAFAHDPGRARALLDEAGYPDPDGDGPRPRLRMTMKASGEEGPRLQATILQAQLRQVGIQLDLRFEEFTTMYAEVLQGAFQTVLMRWVGVTDPDMLRRTFHSDQVPPYGFNRGLYRNPEVDALLDAATATVDNGERRRLFSRAQQIIARDVPYVSLWYVTNVTVARRSLDLGDYALSPTADYRSLRHIRKGPG